MKQQKFTIDGVPALLCGEGKGQCALFVHGQCGSKEEAIAFSQTTGMTTLGIDLPAHGERQGRGEQLLPWLAVPEIAAAFDFLGARFASVSLRANSIGAWLSLTALENRNLKKALLVSPILDMERLILNMLRADSVSEERLEREREIESSLGQMLSWEYLCYAREHTIKSLPAAAAVLYADGDCMTERKTVDEFVERFGCSLTVMKNGEHWFHTPEQLGFLAAWEKENS